MTLQTKQRLIASTMRIHAVAYSGDSQREPSGVSRPKAYPGCSYMAGDNQPYFTIAGSNGDIRAIKNQMECLFFRSLKHINTVAISGRSVEGFLEGGREELHHKRVVYCS